MPKKRIIPQMFDVRPVDNTGGLDWKKINAVEENYRYYEIRSFKNELPDEINESYHDVKDDFNFIQKNITVHKKNNIPKKVKIVRFGESLESHNLPVFLEASWDSIKMAKNQIAQEKFSLKMKNKESEEEIGKFADDYYQYQKENQFHFIYDGDTNIFSERKEIAEVTENEESSIKYFPEENKQPVGYPESRKNFEIKKKPKIIAKNKSIKKASDKNSSVSDYFSFHRLKLNFSKTDFSFAGISLAILLVFSSVFLIGKSLNIKGKVLGVSTEGYGSLASAMENIKNQDFKSSSLEFDKSYEKFSEASKDLDYAGGFVTNISGYLPYVSKLSSGKNAAEAGKHISLAGKSLNDFLEKIYSLKNSPEKNDISLLDVFSFSEESLKTVNTEMKAAQDNLNKIKVDDLPEDKQDEFVKLKQKLPEIIQAVDDFLGHSHIFTDILGSNGPRKFLFLFQNNHEMRATGGFIGSYGLLDIYKGKIRSFFIDGIFNPDGQLVEKIVPPKPIQKISAAWSLHDSNWFPDFPTSAKKAILFYEKTGGPTVDGVITFTPEVMKKLLEVTGPVEMPDYGVTLTSDNFMETTQYEVEEDYDERENNPKKILADLASVLMDKLFNSKDVDVILKSIKVFSEGLSQKHILFYSTNDEVQKIISEQGWSGEIIETPKDYLNVINTNINGFKTDGVVEEKIEHQAEIQEDGSVIDTLTITRHHNGGNTPYEWWNKVNADYMRVYVPFGSKLLEVEGQTREINFPPLDYEALKFRRDADVEQEERNMITDENSGTCIYEQNGKTVFANWTYVSPQETMVIKYKYLLPFKIVPGQSEKSVDTYSMLIQKQAGSVGSELSIKLVYPANFSPIWNYPEDFKSNENHKVEYLTKLEKDEFFALTFKKE